MSIKSILWYSLRLALVFILFAVLFMMGAGVTAGKMPATPSEPGLVDSGAGFLIIVAGEVALLAALIHSSRWGGLKLALLLSLAYYGAVTFMMQIETWYFLSGLTVSSDLLPALFIMRLPVSFIAIPAAVWILGKGKARTDTRADTRADTRTDMPPNPALVMPARQWIWKAGLIAAVYVILYWSAGYFIAWQNPELRAFYGQPGPALSFWEHTLHTLQNDPWLLPFQLLRGLLWMLFALPVVRGSRLAPIWTALLVGLLFSLPQNIGHILANPLLPLASVRLSHLIETASSTFVFGLLVAWLLHRAHTSLADLFGLPAEKVDPQAARA